jgi:predicted MFS family arabinose efflux permease
MAPRQASPTLLLLLFSVAVFLASLSILMLGPLLVSLAHAFHTSVALMGQLTETWS